MKRKSAPFEWLIAAVIALAAILAIMFLNRNDGPGTLPTSGEPCENVGQVVEHKMPGWHHTWTCESDHEWRYEPASGYRG